MGQPSWFMPKTYYENYLIMESYKQFIVSMAKTMNTSLSDEVLEAEVNNMVNLEKRLARVCYFSEFI